jgi:hypothetical protein
MIDMTHRPDVHMRLVALELRLAHDCVAFSPDAMTVGGIW